MARSLPQPLAPGFEVRRAELADVPAIVELIAADQIGATRDGGDLAPYEDAFAAIDADPAQALVVLADAADDVVGTLQLTIIPGLARRVSRVHHSGSVPWAPFAHHHARSAKGTSSTSPRPSIRANWS